MTAWTQAHLYFLKKNLLQQTLHLEGKACVGGCSAFEGLGAPWGQGMGRELVLLTFLLASRDVSLSPVVNPPQLVFQLLQPATSTPAVASSELQNL